jgi:hypothetical protein
MSSPEESVTNMRGPLPTPLRMFKNAARALRFANGTR